MKCKCPKCAHEMELEVFATVPDAQRLTLRIDRGPDASMMSAATMSGFVGNMDKLLKSVAKQIGAKVHVFVERVEWEPESVAFHFVIVNVKGGTAKMTSEAVDRILGSHTERL